MKKILLFALLLPFFAQAQKRETTWWRPNFHFSPEKNWINDPNGLVYYRGEYHLFFQHNPAENKWGNMSWGHAVSKDLLHWQQLPLAIPQDSVWIFSGSVVVDKNNTSGFGKNGGECLVAIYTADYHGRKENQHLAYSNDAGRTWRKYEKNPILKYATGRGDSTVRGDLKDFRDPNVFWHESSQKWIMTVVLPKEYKVQFYGSKNLIDWQFLSDFEKQGDIRKIWECPFLIELPLDKDPFSPKFTDGRDSTKVKWVLMISSNGVQENFTGMQYFVGNFDGNAFKNDNPPDTKLYVDFGKDFYATVPFNNAPNLRKILLGWQASLNYVEALPTLPWKGQMSMPREIWLKTFPEGIRLMQKPVREYFDLPYIKNSSFSGMEVVGEKPFQSEFQGKTMDIFLEFEKKTASEFGIKVLGNSKTGEFVKIGYNFEREELFIDRSRIIKQPSMDFKLKDVAKLSPMLYTDEAKIQHKKIRLHLVIDQSSIEVFANDGRIAMTNLVFPDIDSRQITLYSEGGSTPVTYKIADYNFLEDVKFIKE